VLWTLNGLRAGGALLVMLFHINVWNLQIIRGSGALNGAVGMFFVMSGFVLVWTSRPGTTLGTFAARRLARIVPNHLVTYALGVVLTLLVLGRAVDPWTVVAGAFLLQAWLPSPDMVFAINDVTWSLSCEIAFYACFPVLLRGLRRLRPGVRVALVGAALLVPPAVALTWPSLGTLMFHLPPARLPEFVAGMVAAMAVQSGWRPRVPAPALLGVLGALLLGAAAADVVPLPLLTAVLAVVFAPLCARCAWADAEGRNRWARHPAVMLAGALSFSFYLLHEMVIKVLLQTPLRGWFVVPLVLVVSTALAFLLWRGVELPARAHVLRLLGAAPGHHREARARHGRERRTRWSDPVPAPAPEDRAAPRQPPHQPPRSTPHPAERATPHPALRPALPPAPPRPELPAADIPDAPAGAVAWGVAAAVAAARPVPATATAMATARHPEEHDHPAGAWSAPAAPARARTAAPGPRPAGAWRPPAPPTPRA
jgi:peptidoglycan/LPS O-acetylase OafA/YrhL